MTHTHGLQTNGRFRFDPTRTGAIVRRYEKELRRRFRKLAQEAAQWVRDNDPTSDPLAPKVNFVFRTRAEKQAAFIEFIRRRAQEGVLEIFEGQPVFRSGSGHWQNLYLLSAYQKGVAMAGGQLSGGGIEVSDRWIEAAFNRPVHADRAGLIFTRAFADLEGITQTIEKQLSAVLADAMIEGIGMQEAAKRVSDTVESVSTVRAKRLARTEIIRSHAEASLNTYEEAGIEGVSVLGEFATAGDNKVCRKCASLEEGNPYKMSEARGLIPVHPNCRCAWLPIIENPSNIKLL